MMIQYSEYDNKTCDEVVRTTDLAEFIRRQFASKNVIKLPIEEQVDDLERRLNEMVKILVPLAFDAIISGRMKIDTFVYALDISCRDPKIVPYENTSIGQIHNSVNSAFGVD